MDRGKPQKSFGERFQALLHHLYPERQIHLRTEGKVSFVRFTQRTQIAISLVLFGALGWAAFSTLSFVRNETVLAAKDSEIANSKQSYRSLLGEVSEYQKKFTDLTSDLEDSHSLMIGLVEKNASLRQNLSKVSKKLNLTQSEREQIASARENLKEKLNTIEDKMRNISNQNFSLTDTLSTAESDLQKALAGRNKALYEGTRMSRRIKNLETHLTDLQKTEEQVIQRLSDSTTNYIETMQKVVSVAGLDMKKLLKDLDLPKSAQGGPFIAAAPENLPGNEMKESLANLDTHLSRWEALQGVMKRIPLAPPLNAFYVTSGYGKRRDPINKRWAAHYGLDLGGPLNSSVYAPAPGVVSFAGWKGKYGKLIEVDHGAGLKTRYGHLNKIKVKKGQKIKFLQKIGLLGSTGRSTGAHLHYEVVFRGKSKNPMKFIKAGRNVFQE
ncbi:MAG: peptidoglycan DD-metalloendopeptidase family protein [Alphaproteobacteria bacterium]|jgi:murein DD-endopeptidase MepM/ murein hydrolase activator NlpD|nr:peptidoglycan DD-metalloendopeptidase family protein [Alphaproteobacteria bacterium]MBT7942578.1 peptidoglycan DD-metalloendopeptidase family protein [Alphaproteobacteria bacterium]